MFIGKNNCGKSSVLHAFKYAFSNFEKENLSIEDMRYRKDSSKNPELILKLKFEEQDLEKIWDTESGYRTSISIAVSKGGNRSIKSYPKQKLIEILKKLVVVAKIDLISRIKDPQKNNAPINFVGIEGSNESDKPFMEEFLASNAKKYLEEFEKTTDCILIPAVRNISPERFNTIDPSITQQEVGLEYYDGNGITNLINNFFKESKLPTIRLRRKLTNEFQKLLPELKNSEIIVQRLPQDVYSIFFRGEDDIELPLNNFGTGIMDILLIITILEFMPKNKTLILAIEEPENNLHPALQRKLFNYLKKKSNENLKILITTHSPTFIDKSNLDNVFLIKNNQKTKIQKLQNSKTSELLDEIGAKASDIFQSDLVIFVDGPSDKRILENFSNIIDFNLEENNISILPLCGQNIEHQDPEELKKINNKFILLLDSDKKNAGETIKKWKTDLQTKINATENCCIIFDDKREMENYFSPRAVKEHYQLDTAPTIDNWVDFEKLIPTLSTEDNLISYKKTRDGPKIAEKMTAAEIENQDKLKEIFDKAKELLETAI